MFEHTLTLLLSGEFICEQRYPDPWRLLQDPAQRAEAAALLGRLGRQLAQTRQGGAWFAAYARIDNAERQAIRAEFAGIKHELRFLVRFFVHVMQARHQQQSLAPGDLIEANRLAADIDANPNLSQELRELAGWIRATAGESTIRAMLDRVLKKLVDDGYLVKVNPEREIYQLTGKIEYLQDVVDFLLAYESVPDELAEERDAETPGGQQGLLL